MKNFIKIAGIVAVIAIVGLTLASCGDGSSGSPSGGGGGGGLDTRFFGTWVSDAGISITIGDDDGFFYEFRFERSSDGFTSAARKTGDVFSGVGVEWSIKAVFEGAKLRVTEATGFDGYAEDFNGLYTKQ